MGDEDEWLATYTPGDTRNQIHINEPKVTQLVHGAAEASTEAARAKVIGQFVATFHEQMWRVFLPQAALLTVISNRVKGYALTIRGYTYAPALVNVWLE